MSVTGINDMYSNHMRFSKVFSHFFVKIFSRSSKEDLVVCVDEGNRPCN